MLLDYRLQEGVSKAHGEVYKVAQNDGEWLQVLLGLLEDTTFEVVRLRKQTMPPMGAREMLALVAVHKMLTDLVVREVRQDWGR